MKAYSETKIILSTSLVLLLLCSIVGIAVLTAPSSAFAEATQVTTYVFEGNDGDAYRDQYFNADEIGFTLNTTDVSNPYFNIYAFTYFYPENNRGINCYLWFSGTTGPTTSTADHDAWNMDYVGGVSFVEDHAYCEAKIYLSSLAELPANTTVDVYFGVCEIPPQDDDTIWESIVKAGTITKYVTTQEPLPATPYKTGYTFTGWYTDSACTNLYTLDYIVGNVTLYAGFRANTYTIYFDGNIGDYSGVTGSTSSLSMTYDQAKNLPVCGFTNPGYIFLGWDTDLRAQDPTYTAGQSVKNLVTTNGGSITLYAIWVESNYTVNFNANGGIGSMSNQQIQRDFPVQLSANTFSKTGYHFVGWATSANGAVVYNDKQSVNNIATHNGTITLYAIWQANTYTIYFDGNIGDYSGVTGSTSSLTMTYDEAKNLPASGFTLLGYNFLGWDCDPRAQDPTYTAGQSVKNLVTTNGGSITLHAIWVEAEYTIKFDANGGIGSMANQKHHEDLSLALSANTFTRTGYEFLGWNTNKTATTAMYTNGQAVKDIGSQGDTITLYAVWKATLYTVKFNANGGSGTMSDQTFTYDQAQSLTVNSFVKTGYHFVGWATSAEGSKVYNDSQSVKNIAGTNASITLYAVWSSNAYTVKFNANGGTGTMVDQSISYDAVTELETLAFTRDGYRFKGWATSADGEPIYANCSMVNNLTTVENGTVTLYAVWERIQCTVTFIVDGEVYAVVTVDWGTSRDEIMRQTVNQTLYEADESSGKLPN